MLFRQFWTLHALENEKEPDTESLDIFGSKTTLDSEISIIIDELTFFKH